LYYTPTPRDQSALQIESNATKKALSKHLCFWPLISGVYRPTHIWLLLPPHSWYFWQLIGFSFSPQKICFLFKANPK